MSKTSTSVIGPLCFLELFAIEGWPTTRALKECQVGEVNGRAKGIFKKAEYSTKGKRGVIRGTGEKCSVIDIRVGAHPQAEKNWSAVCKVQRYAEG